MVGASWNWRSQEAKRSEQVMWDLCILQFGPQLGETPMTHLLFVVFHLQRILRFSILHLFQCLADLQVLWMIIIPTIWPHNCHYLGNSKVSDKPKSYGQYLLAWVAHLAISSQVSSPTILKSRLVLYPHDFVGYIKCCGGKSSQISACLEASVIYMYIYT